jgi:hypothetical protein
VKVFYQSDYQMYLDHNSSVTDVFQYVAGFFNSVATIYQNESINFALSTSFGYYSTPDPYLNMTTSDEILLNFGQNEKDNFMGDLAQFITTAHNGQLGGLAWINVLCQPATPYQGGGYQGRFSFANIDNSPHPYPTYSWTVTVSTHEMGHNLGSYHTHACHWVQADLVSIGPLDSCIITQENADPAHTGQGCMSVNPVWQCYIPNQTSSGFVMSYCHFCENMGNGGIYLANGFGRPTAGPIFTQSGDTIRARVQQANCLKYNLNSSDLPTTFALLQNFPNPFNPSTNIRFALPAEGFVTLRVYDITGREVVKLIDSKYYSIGVYSYVFDAGAFNLASGVYVYKLEVNQNNKSVYSQIKKMVLIK